MNPTPGETGIFGRSRWPLLILVTFGPAVSGGFLWLDDQNVTQNLAVRNGQTGLQQIWSVDSLQSQYSPLTQTTYWIEFQLWKNWALGYRIVSLVFHAGAAILLWRVLRRLKMPGAWVIAAVLGRPSSPGRIRLLDQPARQRAVGAAWACIGAFLSRIRRHAQSGHRLDGLEAEQQMAGLRICTGLFRRRDFVQNAGRHSARGHSPRAVVEAAA